MTLDTTKPALQSPGDPSSSALPVSFQKHPVRSAWLLFLAYLVMATLAGLGAKALFPQFQPEFIALIAMSIVVSIALSAWRLWREAGFNAPSAWRDVRLMIFPSVVVLVLPFLGGIQPVEWNSFFYLVVAYALTGFMEEGLMRGIVMRVLKPTGVARSVVLSALLFALIHAGNLLYRNPAIVLAQMVGAFVHGIGLGAIRLRTNTIWIPIILHGLHDLVLKYTRFPVIPLDVIQVTLLMLFGIYLLRTWKPTPETPAA
jgi:membrane protease YdiL (CAAX protease family)